MEIKKITLEETEKLVLEDSIAVIGFFDGVHKMHEKIFRLTKKMAKRNKMKFIVITFSIKIGDYLKKIDTRIMNNKIKFDVIKRKFNPDILFEIIVNDKVISTSKYDFMNFLKNNLNVKKIIVGSDFVFGEKATGDVNDLKEYFGYRNVIVKKRNKKYSSSLLKELIIQKKWKKIRKITKNVNNYNNY